MLDPVHPLCQLGEFGDKLSVVLLCGTAKVSSRDLVGGSDLIHFHTEIGYGSFNGIVTVRPR